jgi:SIR2-like domain
MQFITKGPDIPERLLQAHEDGRVVFFCGAGISYPAGLPGFDGLVTKICADLAITPNDVQKAAIKSKQFDTAIGLLEAEIVGGRQQSTIRRAIAKILTPNVGPANATTTHEALLTLAKNRMGFTRIITTNFDRLFEEVIHSKELKVARYQAPLLPVPKSRWDGLVYLHGLLPNDPSPIELDRLVVSSGDFGLAYLTERWAARFVSELFRNFNVCFIGYSINDPVLRYMMDALAADRLLGESPPEMFAFGSHAKGQDEARANEWRAKNVTPILYRDYRRHTNLHRTLNAWASTYRDGVSGKERIVVECANARPLTSTKQDDFVGRLLWALSDPTGLPARRFADFDPVPSLDWLEPLAEARYRHADLSRFGVPPDTIVNDKLSFSVVKRPSPYSLAPLMALNDAGARGGRWDEVMYQVARWLIRHLDDPKLLLWLVRGGGQLQHNLASHIERRLDEIVALEAANDVGELKRICDASPKAIPRPLMRTLWRQLLTGRVKSPYISHDLYRLKVRLQRDGLTASLRLELREALTPRVSIREPFNWPDEYEIGHEPETLNDLVEWEIRLTADYVHSSLEELSTDESWIAALPELLSDFTMLLRDALDLMRELGRADDKSDLSYIQQPSITKHSQNKGYHDWTALIDLSREAWLALAGHSKARAALVAESWWHVPYPLFRRLALFAAAHSQVISPRRAVDWLLADKQWWLWSVETEREVIRLLIKIVPRLNDSLRHKVEKAILAGPPREMFKVDIAGAHWTQIIDREIWLRLAKIKEAGAILEAPGNKRFDELSAQYPEWKLVPNDRDEFPFWSGDGNDRRKFNATPRRRRALVEWLRQHPNADHWQEDDWRERCRDNFSTTACALIALTKEGLWPRDRWREALQAWTDEKLLKRSWRYMAQILWHAPNDVLQSLANGVTTWLKAVAKIFERQAALFFALAHRILTLDHQDGVETKEPVLRAINHPVGQVTEAMLSWWFRQLPEDGQGLNEEIKPTFTALCDSKIDKYQHGRVLLAANVIALFRADPHWTTQHLLTHFEWQRSEDEASAAWEGFLWSPRLYRPLMVVLKPAFLATARHYASLGKHNSQYSSLLTYAALNPGDLFTIPELAGAIRALPADGLAEVAAALVRSLDGASDQSSEYWSNRVSPFLDSIWPKSQGRLSPEISESFARLCVAAKDAFPVAVVFLRAWLQTSAHPSYLVHQLHEAKICTKFPEQALHFLSVVIGLDTQWPPKDLASCLDEIKTATPDLETDIRFRDLMSFLNQHKY